jgi:hypothetical protein
VQELVEERAVPVGLGRAGEHLPGDVQQFDAVAGGDVGDQAALGGHDHRDALERRDERGLPDGAGLPQCLQARDPGGVAGAAHLRGEPARAGGVQQPGQPRADHVAADQLGQAGAEPVVQFPAPGAEPAGGLQLGQHPPAPVGCHVGLGAGRGPAFLPGRARVQLKPVQDLQHGQFPPVPDLDVIDDERRGEQPPGHREPVRLRRGPGRRDRPGRESRHQRPGLGAELPGRGGRLGPGVCGGHQRPFPNSTSRLSAR